MRARLWIAAGIAALLGAEGQAAARAEADGLGAGARLLVAAAEFRALALDDVQSALERFATAEARESFRQWQSELWPTVPPRTGWSFFFGTSVWTATGLDSGAPRVAFYHPWSDVWLLTDWSPRDDSPRLTRAVVAMGDWLRGEGASFELAPAWLRAGEFAPAALARVTAEALRGFELASAAVAAGEPLGPRQPRAAAVNRAGAALLLAASLRSARDLAVPREGEPARLTALRDAAVATLARVRAGDLPRLAAQAPETLPATRRAVANLAAVERRLVPLHALAVGPARSFVLAGDASDGDLLLGLLYDESGAAPKLLRVDLASHAQAYRSLYPRPAAARPETP